MGRNDIETLSALLTFVRTNRQLPVGFPHEGPVVMRCLYVAFVVGLYKSLNKQSSCWWYETPWCTGDVTVMRWYVWNCTNRPISQIPECAHVCTFLLQNGALWYIYICMYVWCIVEFVMGLLLLITRSVYTCLKRPALPISTISAASATHCVMRVFRWEVIAWMLAK